MALFDRLKAGLAKTAKQIRERFSEVDETDSAAVPVSAGGRALSSGPRLQLDTFEAVEDALIAADVGLPATERIVEAVKRDRQGSLSSRVGREVRRILGEAAPVPVITTVPHVILIVGVNGTGKTTTVGKLANLYKQSGKSVLVCAADTFRAAAVEQLAVWTERAGVDLVRAQMGSDPAAVTFDALVAAKARQREIVLVDTAGRLHTKTNLMAELDKIRRIVSREVPGAPHEVLLVLDATVGQTGRNREGRRRRGHRARPQAADSVCRCRRRHRRLSDV